MVVSMEESENGRKETGQREGGSRKTEKEHIMISGSLTNADLPDEVLAEISKFSEVKTEEASPRITSPVSQQGTSFLDKRDVSILSKRVSIEATPGLSDNSLGHPSELSALGRKRSLRHSFLEAIKVQDLPPDMFVEGGIAAMHRFLKDRASFEVPSEEAAAPLSQRTIVIRDKLTGSSTAFRMLELFFSAQENASATRGSMPTIEEEAEDEEPPAPPTRSLLQKLVRRRNVLRSVFYFTEGRRGATEAKSRDVLTEPVPFTLPDSMRLFTDKLEKRIKDQEAAEQEAKLRYYEKMSYRTRQNKDILERLYIPEEAKAATLTDMDPLFFKATAGRPITKRMSLRNYRDGLRDVFRMKLEAAYRTDEMIKVIELHRQKKLHLHRCSRKIEQVAEIFDEFLFQDFSHSLSVLKSLEEKTAVRLQLDFELKKVLQQVGLVKSRIYHLEEEWRNLKLYQCFLYQISPWSWRKQHDFINRDEEGGLMGYTTDLFDKYRMITSDTGAPMLEAIFQLFDRETEKSKYGLGEEPPLYFTDPMDVDRAFEFIEFMRSNVLITIEQMYTKIEDIKVGLRVLKRKMNEELDMVLGMIEYFQRNIDYEKARIKDLQTIYQNLLQGEVNDTLATEEALLMYVVVEDAFEACIAKNDVDFSMMQMVELLEEQFSRLMWRLESKPSEKVRRATEHCLREETRRLEQATHAHAHFLRAQRLERSLLKALEPAPPRPSTRRPVPRSRPPRVRRAPPPPPPPITDHERELLYFFTPFCGGTDDPAAYVATLRAVQPQLLQASPRASQDADKSKAPRI